MALSAYSEIQYPLKPERPVPSFKFGFFLKFISPPISFFSTSIPAPGWPARWAIDEAIRLLYGFTPLPLSAYTR